MHAGQATPTFVSPNVRVGGMGVTAQPYPYAVSGCGLSSVPSPPCVTANWVSAATRVFAGGAPVLLIDSQAVCTAPGTGVVVLSSQTRVSGQ
jgi:hypothetical protein